MQNRFIFTIFFSVPILNEVLYLPFHHDDDLLIHWIHQKDIGLTGTPITTWSWFHFGMVWVNTWWSQPQEKHLTGVSGCQTRSRTKSWWRRSSYLKIRKLKKCLNCQKINKMSKIIKISKNCNFGHFYWIADILCNFRQVWNSTKCLKFDKMSEIQ